MKIVHYINQFFAQIGGEDQADHPLEIRETVVGPGMALKAALGADAEFVATIICGDNYFSEHTEKVSAQVRMVLEKYRPDLLIAGPAFNAGRYGIACGNVLRIASSMGITAFSGMFPDNPAVDIYRSYGYIVKTKNSAAGMREAVAGITALIPKVLSGPRSLNPAEDGYVARGHRINRWTQKTGAERAMDMMLAKLNGQPYQTELPMPTYRKVPPAPRIKDLSKATIALMTSGGVVPIGNPDHIETAFATKYKKYTLDRYNSADDMRAEVVHGGYDPIYGNEDPNRMIPADVLKELEREGFIGKVYDYIYVTSGNGCATRSSLEFGEGIAQELLNTDVDGILLTSA